MDIYGSMKTNEIVAFLTGLVAAGRLTGTAYADGILVFGEPEPAPLPPVVLKYDQYGFSLMWSVARCVRLQAVDKMKALWLESGNEYQRQVASETPTWYGIRVKGRDYSTDDIKQITANNQSHWSPWMGLIISAFHTYGDRYINIGEGADRGDTKNQLDGAERYSKQWGLNPGYITGTIEDHAAVSWGNAVDPNWHTYEARMGELGAKLVADMDKKAEWLKATAHLGANMAS